MNRKETSQRQSEEWVSEIDSDAAWNGKFKETNK